MPDSLTTADQILIALRQVTQAIDLYSRYLLVEHGLTGPQIGVLRHLDRSSSATPGELSDALHITPPTIVGILNRLEERGLLTRERGSRTDRRSVVVRLTTAGSEAVAKSPPLLRDRFLEQLAQMPTWEQTQMLATLQRVAHLMQADEISAEPFLHRGPAAPASTAMPATGQQNATGEPTAIAATSPVPRHEFPSVASTTAAELTTRELAVRDAIASLAISEQLSGCDPPL
ncbi:transcriptional regulator, MarR family [Pirellula staleyi DSM 6068]|uniref:Transcriptional regulator, MarR family n=1 Tax=Pirellula staleyi (strain ATCC 27377 / DSM 6068 / ICPB 4128) TaxID=530564 RepID=D2R2K8_PIRSD|nr:MarR family winged helix-turn-helix transcriptional regulator [Pirellula staleyi]ADB16848.1 transcriptional regulator, MarR family [Pirellula staleyi DSM 6068]